MLKNALNSYGSISKIYHWLVSLLVLVLLLVGYFMDDISNKALRPEVFNLHKLTGLIVLLLMLLRLLWALSNPKPALPGNTPFWQHLSARLVHSLLYLLLILMPLSGWIMSAAGGRPPKLGSFGFYLPVPLSKPLSRTAFDVHSWLAIGIIVLIVIHTVAALYHHYILKDNILRRMWFGAK